MSNGHDRFENDGGGSFVIGLLAGTVLGAGLGMLFAPKTAAELRGQVSDQATGAASSTADGLRRVDKAGVRVEKNLEKILD